LCERIQASPKDCEDIARLYKTEGRHAEAMAWVERGLAVAGALYAWSGESHFGLESLKRELLSKGSREEKARQNARSPFEQMPSALRAS
jgi:hypothetical protein